jgi:hypothetical protein
LPRRAALPAVVSAQKPTAATYITDEEVKKVNSTPGVDRQIRVVDVGDENFAVGVVHRGARRGARRGRWRGAGRRGAGRGAAPALERRPARSGAVRAARNRRDRAVNRCRPPPAGGQPAASRTIADRGLSDHLGRRNARHRRQDRQRQQVGAGRGGDEGAERAVVQRHDRRRDVVKKVVKTGDIIIIPAGVPHGWTDIGDHVDYLSFRPSARVLTRDTFIPRSSRD